MVGLTDKMGTHAFGWHLILNMGVPHKDHGSFMASDMLYFFEKCFKNKR